MKKLIIASVLSIAALTGTAIAHDHDKGEHKGKHKDYMVEQKLEKMDLNKDGVITLEESQEASKKMFTETDADKDGKVTRAELETAVEKQMKEKHADMKEMKEKNKTTTTTETEVKTETKE